MAFGIVNLESLEDIGDALREQLTTSRQYYPEEMAAAVRSIQSSGYDLVFNGKFQKNTTGATQWERSAVPNTPDGNTWILDGWNVMGAHTVKQVDGGLQVIASRSCYVMQNIPSAIVGTKYNLLLKINGQDHELPMASGSQTIVVDGITVGYYLYSYGGGSLYLTINPTSACDLTINEVSMVYKTTE